MSELYVLVCGRESFMDRTEKGRLVWRGDKTIIGGSKVLCMTYDDLVRHFAATLEMARAIAT
jgi:hypothetical protein